MGEGGAGLVRSGPGVLALASPGPASCLAAPKSVPGRRSGAVRSPSRRHPPHGPFSGFAVSARRLLVGAALRRAQVAVPVSVDAPERPATAPWYLPDGIRRADSLLDLLDSLGRELLFEFSHALFGFGQFFLEQSQIVVVGLDAAIIVAEIRVNPLILQLLSVGPRCLVGSWSSPWSLRLRWSTRASWPYFSRARFS